jgi:hypothetical protein
MTDEHQKSRERWHLRFLALGAILFAILGMGTGGAGVHFWEQRSRRATFDDLKATIKEGHTLSQPFSRYSIACSSSACYRLDVVSGEIESFPPNRGLR